MGTLWNSNMTLLLVMEVKIIIIYHLQELKINQDLFTYKESHYNTFSVPELTK